MRKKTYRKQFFNWVVVNALHHGWGAKKNFYIRGSQMLSFFSVLWYIFMRKRKCENIGSFLFTRSDL